MNENITGTNLLKENKTDKTHEGLVHMMLDNEDIIQNTGRCIPRYGPLESDCKKNK